LISAFYSCLKIITLYLNELVHNVLCIGQRKKY
jgi:hypothetical protein